MKINIHMVPKTDTNPDLKTKLKEINHDLDQFDKLVSQIDEQGELENLEQKIDNQN